MTLKNNDEIPLNIHYPNWVNWLAQDEDGAWWGYSVEPLEFSRGWYENEVGLRIKISQSSSNPDWKNSLMKINK